MSTISKKFLELESNAKATHLKVEVYYTKGGYSYFTGGTETRGIKLSVSPVSRSESEGGIVVESYTAFTGFKKHLKDMARFSQKACDSFVVDANEEKTLIEAVLLQNGLKLK
jgi:hypothetical protein